MASSGSDFGSLSLEVDQQIHKVARKICTLPSPLNFLEK